MDDLIYRYELLKKVTKYCCESCDLDEVVVYPCEGCLVMDAATKIKEAPTVDAVPVIRCKDCRWNIWARCTRFEYTPVTNDDYCSKGERREDADTN